MNTGGYALLVRSGAASGTNVEAITESLVASKGAAYDGENGSLSWLECHAIARAIAAYFSFLRKVSNQKNPSRCEESLPRWERIFNVLWNRNASKNDRRAELAIRFGMIGKPSCPAEVSSLLASVMPNVFDSLVHTSQSDAEVWTDVAVTVTGGIDTASTGLTGAWSSSASHVAVLVAQPAGMTDQEFYAEAGRVVRYLDDYLPAWCTYDWVRDATAGAGFYLDEPSTSGEMSNLDNMRFG